jgi:hypothetical protein
VDAQRVRETDGARRRSRPWGRSDPREEPERTDDAKQKAELDKADICVSTEIHALLRHPSRGL